MMQGAPPQTQRSHRRQQRMEPLWSPVVATGGNQQQIGRPSKSQKQAKSVATGCHRLPEAFHGKGRVAATSSAKECHEEGPPPVTRSGLSLGAIAEGGPL